MSTKNRRSRIDVRISKANFDFLTAMVKTKKATHLADATDQCIDAARRADSREHLETSTAKYYEALCGEDLAEEIRLEIAMAHASRFVDSDE
jgi:hypothetical protein